MSQPPSFATGERVLVDELAETPLEAIERHVRLELQPPPDVASLDPADVQQRVQSLDWVEHAQVRRALGFLRGKSRLRRWHGTRCNAK